LKLLTILSKASPWGQNKRLIWVIKPFILIFWLRLLIQIGADGPNSLVRAAAGISSFGYKYNQMGLVATLEIDTLENNTAWQRFLSSGPIAILPLSLTHSSLVWSLPGQLAKDVARLSENDLILVLNAALRNPAIDLEYILRNLDTGIDIKQELEFGFQRNPDLVPRNLPVVKNVTDCASFPLSIQHVDTYESKGCALVGDAAHSIHPLAGQGMNLGFGDVKSLVSCIEKNLQNNVVDSAGYTSQRYLANATMLTACDLINRLNGRFISSANFPIFKSYLMQMMD
jgi:ubiquinone biosynthesis monooxygenase Coq6